MLCKTARYPFDDPAWAFEIKWDGYRAIAEIIDDDIKIYSRNGMDLSSKFKSLKNALLLQEQDMILDGEIVAYDDDGKPNFQQIQNIQDNPFTQYKYQVFDLLWLNGYSTEELTYLQRKELLKQALIESEYIQYHDYIIEHGKAFYESAKKWGLEGIIAKKTDSLYKQNLRSSEWLKIKIHQTDEAIIVGFTEPKSSGQPFGALILGKYQQEELVFCGHVGSGFSQSTMKDLYELLKKNQVKKSPFSNIPKTNGKASWVKLKYIAEIQFTALTDNKIYRHPIFLKLREDKNVEEVKFEESGLEESPTVTKSPTQSLKKLTVNISIPLTNTDKIYFPKDGITKYKVIEYYQSISPFILPHLKDRPQSLHRYPNGIHGLSFYQKDTKDFIPDWIESTNIYSESSEKEIRYMLCNNANTLAYMNNLGCIEMNIWSSRINQLEYPDYLVLDLDPSEKNTFDEVIETCLVVEEVLKNFGIKSYPKTSGSTGMHVYIPMGAKYQFEQVKLFGNLIMQMVHEYLPTITTLERNLKKRANNMIYLDYLQNRKGQTLASVYSLRPRDGAAISMPLRWEEVKPGIRPTDFNLFNCLDRLKQQGDLFEPVLGKGIDLLEIISNQ